MKIKGKSSNHGVYVEATCVLEICSPLKNKTLRSPLVSMNTF